MKPKSPIHRAAAFFAFFLAGMCTMTSCMDEDRSMCELLVKFKYDYNLLSADAFHTQVDKVELFVFDANGVFLFQQSEEGEPLASGSYRMKLRLDAGEYKMMAWAGARDSYRITPLIPGTSRIEELRLRLERDQSLIIDRELEPLWYGGIIDVRFAGGQNQTETISLVKNTNKLRFVFQGLTPDWVVDKDDYTFELLESNGYMDYTNALLPDDTLSYRPYFAEQNDPSSVVVELNTLRLMADRNTRFTVTHNASGQKVFDINLTNFLLMLRLEEHGNWSNQEYLDREDQYKIVFFFSPAQPGGDQWLALRININGWTWYIQHE